MTITLSIACDNAAFGRSSHERDHEVARILRRAADRLIDESVQFPEFKLMDINGNAVGKLESNDE